MPEIPEIQVIIDGIKNEVIEKTVDDIVVFDDRRVDANIIALKGRTLTDVFRNGKAIILAFDPLFLMFHLRLHGFVRVVNSVDTPERGWIVALKLEDKYLVLGDTRKLAEARIIRESDLKDSPDAWNISREEFKDVVSSPAAIKSVLLNQNKILGLGNRYVDEILWRSHIHPKVKGVNLSEEEIDILFENMKKVLKEAYEMGGDEHYTDVYGNAGRWQASVHGKKTCPVCGSPLKKVKVGGRTSYICPKCQVER